MNRAVFNKEVKQFIIKIRSVQSGKYLITKYSNSHSFDPKHQVIFEFNDDEIKKLNIGQHYKIQMAYVTNDEFNTIGYYSTVGVVKYTTKPTVEIDGLEHGEVNTHNYQYAGLYSQESGDTTEKAYSYCFNLYDNEDNLIQTSGEQIHNSSLDTEYYSSIDLYNIQQDLEINKSYFLEYIVTTMNKMTVRSPKYRIMQKKSIDPEIRADLIPTANFENGYVTINLQGHYNDEGLEYAATGSFKILRANDEDNYAAWNEVLRFALYGQQPSRWIWRDLTVKQGVTYKYALQQYNDSGLLSNRLESDEVYVDFEHAFLFDGKRQLKIKYNPKVSSFKNDIFESKVDTIGGQYPFIFRNGRVKYKEFPISGLISCQLDDEFLFVDEGNLEKFDGTTNLVSDNIAVEREFKLEVLEWLNNGEPKLFRSPTEGNYIVRLLNVSMTPNDTVGRMLHSFNATAYEIAEHNYDNLTKYNLISTADPTVEQLRWETIQLNKSGIATKKNILNYKAVALRFEGMVPGDRIYINDGIERTGIDGDKQVGFYVVIGVTGSYIIDLSLGAEIVSVSFDDNSVDNKNVNDKLVQHQGTLTYAYYSRVQNRFDSITNVIINDVPVHQFIGEHNIIDEIEDIRTKIHSVYWIKASLREVVNGYLNNDREYFVDRACTVPLVFDNYLLYHITDLATNTKEQYWWEPSTQTKYYEYDPCIYFSLNPITGEKDTNKGMNLEVTKEYVLKNPKDIKTLIAGNGVMVEFSYQVQILEYKVETDPKYEDLNKLKETVDKLYADLSYAIHNSDGDNKDTIDDLRDSYNSKYIEFIAELERVLAEEEATQGDIVV